MLNVAFPLLIVPVPSVAAPSLKVTDPVAAAGATVAVNFTEPPKADGLAEDARLTEEDDFPRAVSVRAIKTGQRATSRHVNRIRLTLLLSESNAS